MAPDLIGPEVEAMAAKLKPGDVLLLENTRFYKGEEKNDPQLAEQLAKLGDLYVNDAFGAATVRMPLPKAWPATGRLSPDC